MMRYRGLTELQFFFDIQSMIIYTLFVPIIMADDDLFYFST